MMESDNLSKRAISIGVIVWLISIVDYFLDPTFFSQIESLLLFGVGIVTPLALRIVSSAQHTSLETIIYRIIWQFQPVVIIVVGLAFVVHSDVLSGLLTIFWIVQTGLIAKSGLLRLQTYRFMIEEWCISAGLLYIPISGVWLISYNVGYAFMTFDKAFVLLTAVHFTFITMGALVIVGVIGRQLYQSRFWNVYRVIAALIIVSPGLVATGITVSQYWGHFWIETSAVAIFAGSLLLLIFLYLSSGLPENRVSKGLIFLSLLTLMMTMILALTYSFGRLTGDWGLTLEFMVQWHGWINAIGFSFLGLLAWNIDLPSARLPER